MRRSSHLVITAGLAASVLSGCGNDSSDTPAAGAPSTASTPRTSSSASCLSKDLLVRPLNTTGMPKPVAQAAAELRRAALACDSKTLTRLAAGARLSFGDGATAARVFALPQRQDRRYDTLLKLLSTPPARNLPQGATTANYVWPRAWSAQTNPKDPAPWQDLVDARLLTPTQVKAYHRPSQYPGDNGHYLGWRIEMSPTGKLEIFTQGD